MSEKPSGSGQAIEELLDVMRRLRDPDRGCPWDLRQNFDSIVPYTIEETYELADAIAAKDFGQVRDELGDVLFQVVFYSQLASEGQLFNFTDVVAGISDKLRRRHPHVFENNGAAPVTEAQVKDRWEQIKSEERLGKNQIGLLDDIPSALPALSRAQKLQKRAARAGFDWQHREDVVAKLDEEVVELKEALDGADQAHIEAEFGDILLAMVNLARHLSVDAESALRQANQRFESRFRLMEQSAEADGSSLDSESLQKLEARWQEAKQTLSST